MTTDHNNVCAVIHEPDVVTITMNLDQLLLLEQIMDMVSDDDDPQTPCVDFAAAMHREIYEEVKRNIDMVEAL